MVFSNCIGSFVLDEQFQLKDYILFSTEDSIQNARILEQGSALEVEQKLTEQYKARKPDAYETSKILEIFREDIYLKKFRETNMALTKLKLKESVNADIFASNAIGEVDEIIKGVDVLVKRLREWYAWYNPEFERATEDNQTLVESILSKDRGALLEELRISESIGADFKQEDLDPIMACAQSCKNLYSLKVNLEQYIERVLSNYAPNMQAIAGPLLTARLIKDTGSLKRLAMMKSSIIQIIGAEKALFRHIRTGAKPPKYGVLFTHPLVQKVNKKEQGKVARAIADKLAIAAKVDFFKGEFVGDKLKAELEHKFLGVPKEETPPLPDLPEVPNVDATPATVEEWKDGEVREKIIHLDEEAGGDVVFDEDVDAIQANSKALEPEKEVSNSKGPAKMEISEDIFKDLEFKE